MNCALLLQSNENKVITSKKPILGNNLLGSSSQEFGDLQEAGVLRLPAGFSPPFAVFPPAALEMG
jgi:hypothetical protein